MRLHEYFCSSLVGKFITIKDIDGKAHGGFVVSMKRNSQDADYFDLVLEDNRIEKIMVTLESKIEV